MRNKKKIKPYSSVNNSKSEKQMPSFNSTKVDNLKISITKPIPQEVQKEQDDKTIDEIRPDKIEKPHINLFYSFDIVNSTAYKSMTVWWPIVIRELVSTLRKRVADCMNLQGSIMWRVIGDEIIFVLPIQNEDTLIDAVDSIFEILQLMVKSLKNGEFIKTINNQSIKGTDSDILAYQTQTLSLKGAAWIAAVSSGEKKINHFYDNISFDYRSTGQNSEMHEFLGADIDAGFRIKQQTMDRRLVVSFELAYFLNEKRSRCLYIIDYVRLKGVWNNSLYPVIWYYNQNLIEISGHNALNDEDNVPASGKLSSNNKEYSFARSFHYDETESNELVRKYFARGRPPKKKNNNRYNRLNSRIEKDDVFLADGMYSVSSAFPQLIKDRNLQGKINYLKSLFTDEVFNGRKYNRHRVELHYAVICYDAKSRKVMIAKRSNNHSSSKEKWDFGCAKAISDQGIIDTIKEYYKETFAIDINPVVNNERDEKQPIPIALYEINKENYYKKGIVAMAEVVGKENFRPSDSYVEIRWITKNEADQMSGDETVRDFSHSIDYVFEYMSKTNG